MTGKNNGGAFWETKPLDKLSGEEWESLCDGCGKCCLEKLEDADTGEISYTDVACRLLDLKTCRCTNYAERKRFVPDCERLTAQSLPGISWLPATCSYRLLAEGRGLPSWHPLVSGNSETVHRAGVSVRGRAVPEKMAGDLEDHIVDWPR